MAHIQGEFENGYSLSIIDHGYGSRDGLYEVAVKYDGEIVYDTPITHDVIGNLTEAEVKEIAKAVEALPPRQIQIEGGK